MIEKITVGKRYNIVGNGNWSDVSIDLVVLGVTVYSQLDPQGIDMYNAWFADRGLDESLLEQFMDDDPYIYHCRKLSSRDPSIEDNNGEEVYIFPGMVNYMNSSQLIDAEILAYRVTLSPFTTDDPLYPFTRSTDVTIRNAMREFMRSLVYDGSIIAEPTGKILVTDTEYQALQESRNAIKKEIDTQTDEDAAALIEERMYMFTALEANDTLSKTLSDKQFDIDKEMIAAANTMQEANAKQEELSGLENKLRSKLNSLVAKINQWNTDHPNGPMEDIPTWDNV